MPGNYPEENIQQSRICHRQQEYRKIQLVFFLTVFSVFFLGGGVPKTVPSVEILIMEGCPGTNNKNLPLVIPLTCVVALCHMVTPKLK
jgi:hypothetical protein